MGILEASLTLQSVLRAPAVGNREPWGLPISLQGRNPEYCLLTCREYLRVEMASHPALDPSIRSGLEYSNEGSTFLTSELGSSLASLPSPKFPLPGEIRQETGVPDGQLLSHP